MLGVSFRGGREREEEKIIVKYKTHIEQIIIIVMIKKNKIKKALTKELPITHSFLDWSRYGNMNLTCSGLAGGPSTVERRASQL